MPKEQAVQPGQGRYALTQRRLAALLLVITAAGASASATAAAPADAAAGPATAPHAAALSQTEQIERLLAAIAALDGARFIRNGKDYSPADAAAHLRRKWQSARRGAAVDDAERFIDTLASTSSVSGQPYRIRFADGNETTVREFLQAELVRLRAP